MVQLTVVGSLNYDLVSYTERIPEAGETFAANSFETHIGGKGLNQTISLAKLSPHVEDSPIKVRIIGKVGDDQFGKELVGALEEQNVDVKDVEVIEDVRSGVAVIIVEKSTGENRILITAGANGETKYSTDELVSLFPPDSEREVVVFQNEIPGTIDTIKWLKENRAENIEVVYNPSPYSEISAEVIDKVDILVVNEGEALEIAKDILPTEDYTNFKDMIKKDEVDGFLQLAIKLKAKINPDNSNVVVITLGSKGSIFTAPKNTGTTSKFVESVKVDNVVDTTGAGDTFLGGLITQVSLGQDLESSIRFATKASSLAIQQNGAASSIPTFEQVTQQL